MIHLTNWNCIDIPIDVFEFNDPIFWKSMCNEADKKKYEVSMGRSTNFSGFHHFSDTLLIGTTPTKETFDHEFFEYSKICCPCIDTASNTNLTGP